MGEPRRAAVLLVRAGARICALPLAHVVETMRPLKAAPLSGTPAFVKGAAVVRGAPAPVVHLDEFLGTQAAAEPTRFVLVRCGGRFAALAVDAVVGVADLDALDVRVAPLLANACAGAVECLGALDEELLLVLRTARLVPDDVWRALEPREAIA